MSTIYFEKNKTIPSKYLMKEQDITLDINITTKSIIQKENSIKILYLVVDSNTEYEYFVEMSDK